jgi:heme/copper-type cytochrome/quinol oxidase subunit 2
VRRVYHILLALLSFVPLWTARAFELAIIPKDIYKDHNFHNGNVTWEGIAHLLLHWIQMMITLAGAIAVILLMIAGFQYTFGKMVDDNEGGKNTIKNTLIGFAVVILAWLIVDILISFLTEG